MLEKTGIPTEEMLKKALPSDERRRRGPYAMFECFQRIPCNPCYTACKVGAVKPFNDINDLPEVDLEKCTGCGQCISACPGLAIFVIDETYSPTEALVKIPYEYLPVPEVGSQVEALNRAGEVVGKAKVVRVQNPKNKTMIVWLAIPKELSLEVRGIRVNPVENEAEEEWRPSNDEIGPSIVCRCEDVSLEKIQELLSEGLSTANEIKRRARTSMGQCQGKTCIPLVLQEIARSKGIPMGQLKPPTYRQPIKPVKLRSLASTTEEDKKE